MADDIFSPEVSLTRKWKQRSHFIAIYNPLEGTKSVLFHQQQVPFENGVANPSGVFNGCAPVQVVFDSQAKVVKDINYKSPLSGQAQTIKVADLMEAVAQYYLDSATVLPAPSVV